MPTRPVTVRTAASATVLAVAVLAAALAVPAGRGALGAEPSPRPAARPTPDPTASPPVQPGDDPTPAPPVDPDQQPDTDPGLYPEPVAEQEPPVPGVSPDCTESPDPVAAADRLLADRYRLGDWPSVTLPHDLAWTEDPYGDANWRFRFHSLRYVLDLVAASQATGDAAYLDRALELTADWIADNPRDGAPSDMSWNDHSTALRAVVLACLADQLPWPDWLEGALRLHGETLADPAFYVAHGNHALNQSIGLLEVGRVLGDAGWVALAGERIDTLIEDSIDKEGVTNEGSLGYQLYNYRRYTVARDRLVAVGLEPSAAFARVARMPELLAYGTLPWGVYELIGDTTDAPAAAIPGTWAEFAATAGRSGPRPPSKSRLFAAGYLFGRSGWGERRPFRRETAFSVRWGPAAFIHGHHDGGSLTLAAWGSRLLMDPGMYAYQGGRFRSFMRGRTAHNVVTVDGVPWSDTASTRLVGVTAAPGLLDVRLRLSGYAGVDDRRRVTYSRALDYLVVEDRLQGAAGHTFRQLWHLPADANPTLGADAFRTRRTRGNVLVRQLAGDVRQRLVIGRASPIQGWISPTYASLIKAPVVEAVQEGRSVRFVTLIVPARDRPRVEVLAFALTPGGYSLRVRIGDRTQRIVADGPTVTIGR